MNFCGWACSFELIVMRICQDCGSFHTSLWRMSCQRAAGLAQCTLLDRAVSDWCGCHRLPVFRSLLRVSARILLFVSHGWLWWWMLNMPADWPMSSNKLLQDSYSTHSCVERLRVRSEVQLQSTVMYSADQGSSRLRYAVYMSYESAGSRSAAVWCCAQRLLNPFWTVRTIGKKLLISNAVSPPATSLTISGLARQLAAQSHPFWLWVLGVIRSPWAGRTTLLSRPIGLLFIRWYRRAVKFSTATFQYSNVAGWQIPHQFGRHEKSFDKLEVFET